MEELKAVREAKGLSQYELAKRSGISRTMIHHMENGKRNPTLITSYAIASALGLEFSALAEKAEKLTEERTRGKQAPNDSNP